MSDKSLLDDSKAAPMSSGTRELVILQYLDSYSKLSMYQEHMMDVIDDYAKGATVILEVGPTGKKYGFSADVLIRASDFFEALLNGSSVAWKECKTVYVGPNSAPVPQLTFPAWNPVAVKAILHHILNESFVMKVEVDAESKSEDRVVAQVHVEELRRLAQMLGLSKMHRIATSAMYNIHGLHGEVIQRVEELCQIEEPTCEEIESIYAHFAEMATASYRTSARSAYKAACKVRSETALAVIDSSPCQLSQTALDKRHALLQKYIVGYGQTTIDLKYFRNAAHEYCYKPFLPLVKKTITGLENDVSEISATATPLFPGMPQATLTVGTRVNERGFFSNEAECTFYLPVKYLNLFKRYTKTLNISWSIGSKPGRPCLARVNLKPEQFLDDSTRSDDTVAVSISCGSYNLALFKLETATVQAKWVWHARSMQTAITEGESKKTVFNPRVYVRDFDTRGVVESVGFTPTGAPGNDGAAESDSDDSDLLQV